jgi:uncharacterized protein YggT (Ycf19 family)
VAVTALIYVLNALRLLVVADAVFSLLALSPVRPPRSLTKPLLDPVYSPWRETLGHFTAPIDLTPLVALAVLYFVQRWLERMRARATGGAG